MPRTYASTASHSVLAPRQHAQKRGAGTEITVRILATRILDKENLGHRLYSPGGANSTISKAADEGGPKAKNKLPSG